MPKLAVTPPVVGSVNIGIYNPPSLLNLASFELVFANCINDNADSCMRAPPDEQINIKGDLLLLALSMHLEIISPTAEPILPPMKEKFIAPRTIFFPSIFPSTQLIASLLPVFSIAFFN